MEKTHISYILLGFMPQAKKVILEKKRKIVFVGGIQNRQVIVILIDQVIYLACSLQYLARNPHSKIERGEFVITAVFLMVSECVNLEILRYVTGPGVRTSVTVCAERQTEHQPTDTVDPAGNPERREKPPSYHPTVDWLIGKNSAIINRHLIFFTIKLFNS